jgi:hypothetical protein
MDKAGTPLVNRRAVVALLVLVAGGLIWLVFTSSNGRSSASPSATILTAAQQQAQAAQKAKVRQDTIAELGPAYCKSHAQVQMGKVDALERDGWPGFSSIDDVAAGRGLHGFTTDQCSTIIGKFYDLGTPRNELVSVVEGRVCIGMTYIELLYSIGYPDDINTTTTAAGTHQQWVYGNKTYVYLDNGKVTSYQT